MAETVVPLLGEVGGFSLFGLGVAVLVGVAVSDGVVSVGLSRLPAQAGP